MTDSATSDTGTYACDAKGPATERRGDIIMSRMLCDREPGHDGPHRSGTAEWGGDGD